MIMSKQEFLTSSGVEARRWSSGSSSSGSFRLKSMSECAFPIPTLLERV